MASPCSKPPASMLSAAGYVPLALLLVVLASAACHGASASQRADVLTISTEISTDPPQGLLVDAWYQLRLVDQPMGYMRTAIQRKADHIESLDYTQIRVSRGSVAIKVIIKTVTVETVDGQPLEMHTEQVMGNQPVKYDATWRPDATIDLRITQGGNTITRQIPADPQAVLPWRKVLDILKGQRKPGESFVERSYAFVSDTKPLEVSNDYQGKGELTLSSGRTVPVLRYKVSNQAMAAAGEVLCEPRLLIPLKLDVPVISSMVLTAVIAARDQAMASDSSKPAELFESLMLRAKVLGARDPSQAPAVLYTMKVEGDAKLIDIVPTDMQHVVSRQGSTIRLLVARRADDKPSGQGRIPAEDLAPYRKASAYANSDDPAVQRMAGDAVGATTNALDVAIRLTHYVHQKMSKKDLDIAFATASEAARTLEGDCTEHAVLLAALARAQGLASRGVLGMVALPGSLSASQLTFGYHMWTQIYVNNRWMDFDAAFDQPRPDATHIALGISDLADSAITQGSVKTFMQLAGTVQLTAEPRN